jgi:hypothetical protein
MAKKIRYDDYPDRGEQRRHWRTEFSDRFPDEGSKPRVNKEEVERRRRNTLVALAAAGCVSIVLLGFFVTLVLLNVSQRPPQSEEESGSSAQQTQQTEQSTSPAKEELSFDKIRTAIAPQAALGGGSALNSFIKSAQDNDCGAAVFVLKTPEGSVLYPSELEEAQEGDILKKQYASAWDSIARAQKAGLKVIVALACFEDSTAPYTLTDAAVRYSQDTRVLWLDDYPDKGGKPWLNPFSAQAQNYLIALVKEVAELGPDAILLTGVQFPSGAQSLAAFPGEDSASAPTRNVLLLQFIKKAKTAAGKLPLLCEMDASAALQTSGAAIYGGSLWGASADVLVIPVSGSAELKLLEAAAPKGKAWLPQANINELEENTVAVLELGG